MAIRRTSPSVSGEGRIIACASSRRRGRRAPAPARISPSPPRSYIDGASRGAAGAAREQAELSVEASDDGPEPLESRELEAKADRAGAGLSRRGGAEGGRASARRLSPAGVRRRGAQAQARARQGDGRRGVPAAGRRLRRELRRAFGRQHPRLLPRLPADGGGDDLRRGLADHQGRARRRAIRQAALVTTTRRSAASRCPPTAATSSTTSSSRPKRARPIRAGRSRPIASRRRRSTCCAPSPPAATPTSKTRIAGCSASSRTARSRSAIRKSPTASPRRSASCARSASTPRPIRNCAPPTSTPRTRRCCSATKQAMTRLDSTSGDYYATSGHMLWIGDRTRQLGGAHVEYCRGIRNPIGLKCGPTIQPDDLHPPDRRARPGAGAGAAVADLPLRRRQDRRGAAAADPRGEARGAQGPVGLRPHARQHDQDRDRLQDPADRAHRFGNPFLLRHPPRRRQPTSAASIWR